MKARTLDELLREFLSRRDASAMEEIVRRTRPRLLRVAQRIGSPQDAPDSVQAAYHSLLARGGEWSGAPPLAWLVTAVVRIAYRRKAVAQRQHELARRLDRPQAAGTPLAHLARDETNRIVRRAVIALPAKYRDVVALHHLEGLSTSEVARLLGVPPSTVTTRLRRARKLLRRRLSPRLVHGVMLLPWLIQDAAKAASPLSSGIGVIMQTKTVATVLVVGLASGAAGFGAANVANARGSGLARANSDDRTVRELQVELERAQHEVRDLRELALSKVARTPSAQAAVDGPTEVAQATYSKRPGRAKVWDAALRLKVSPEAMEAAIKAETAIGHNADNRYELIEELTRFGEEGFRAALAIVLGGTGAGQPQEKLLKEAYLPGLEGLLLEALDTYESGVGAKCVAIRTLAKADTPIVREHLVHMIEEEKDLGIFWALTMALGELKEPRAASAVGSKLLFDEPRKEADWKPMRVGMLHSLSQMGGDDATRILAQFLRDARVTRGEEITQALNSLAMLDKPLCGELAHEILETPRGKALSEQHAKRVADFLGFRSR